MTLFSKRCLTCDEPYNPIEDTHLYCSEECSTEAIWKWKQPNQYIFNIEMIGEGINEHEAWQDACEYMLENIRGFLKTPRDFELVRVDKGENVNEDEEE